MDATNRINDLIEITERLANLLTAENRALRDKNASEATQFIEEKSNLSRIYETRIKGIMEDPSSLSTVAPELREKLHELGN